MKKCLALLLSLLLVIGLLPAMTPTAQAADSALPEQRALAEKRLEATRLTYDAAFAAQPSVSAPYAAGALTRDYLQTGLAWLNYIRLAAGLPDAVLDDAWNESAQYGAVLLAANKQLSHYPPQPADMDDTFFQKGAAATASSNIHSSWGYSGINNLVHALTGFMSDGDTGNISRVGHRRWLINPLKEMHVGFGEAASDNGSVFVTTKVFDSYVNYPENMVDYDFIAWPAKGAFPSELIATDDPWSVTLNPERYATPDESSVSVSVTRLSDQKTWTLGMADINSPNSNTPYFHIDTGGYGVSNCIIFRPADWDADSFDGAYRVTVSGLRAADGSAATLDYTVDFFDVTAIDLSPAPADDPTPSEAPNPPDEPTPSEAPTLPDEPTPSEAPKDHVVVLSPQKLMVDGVYREVEKYNIDDSNYFKLRDLAYLLSGTGSRFSVGWDSVARTASIRTGELYVPDGSELVITGDHSASAVPSTQTIMINGVVRSDLSAFNIGDYNYFKLRALCDVLNFDVDYDESTNTAIVLSRPVEHLDQTALTSEQIYARCMPAVFYIEVYDADGNAIASGSGFFIDGEGTAVTNHHVIYGASSAKVTLSDSRGNDLETVDVLGVYDWSEEEDWAVLKVDISGNSYLRLGDPSTAVGGAAVYALGSPLGFSASISDGMISNPARVADGQTYLQISAPISHGSSGGALVNSFGEVIGITAAGYDDGQNLNLAIPIQKIENSARGDLTPIAMTYTIPSGIVYPAQRSVTLRPGETIDEVITAIKYDTEELLTVVYEIEDESIVTCSWEGWSSGDTEVTLHLTAGNTFGTTTVSIYLYTKDSGELLDYDYIYVTVAGGELTLSKTETEIDLNGYDVVWITTHCFDSRTYKLRYSDPSSGMLNLSWGDWSDDAAGKKIGLYMAALSAGSTELTIEMFDADTGETLATAIVHVHVVGGRLTISETDLVMRPGETYTVTITGEPVVPGVVTNLYADEWPSDAIDWKRGLLGSGTVECTVTAKGSGWDCINISLADAAGNILADGWIDVYVQAGTITAETEELTVLKGETQTVMFSAEVFNGRPVTFITETSEGGAVSCAVGAWDAAAGTIPVTVTGLSYGSAYVSLVMLDAETEEFLTSAGVSVLVPGGTLTVSDTELMLAPGESKVVTITGAAYEPGVSAVISADEWGSSIFDYPQGELGVGTAQLTITAKAEGWDFMLISMTDAEGNFLNEQWIEVYVSADGKGADE